MRTAAVGNAWRWSRDGCCWTHRLKVTLASRKERHADELDNEALSSTVATGELHLAFLVISFSWRKKTFLGGSVISYIAEAPASYRLGRNGCCKPGNHLYKRRQNEYLTFGHIDKQVLEYSYY